ncbi:DUF2270 domain-containing protein [Vitiosangium sp. GDMCC 1.1324]|uniref:DUF2270 domain-containing protein n=1 Tax=Vitiosangium sp. (strain GDMCC 1.1324) TaxID=2138576 RepID=UPI000D389C26|nr:DUF2270 domain-containing protein [Vitiosangium sp. GDMCC 1.1324]PTL84153.1 hypothetical protein DAT35_11995 [Vitiosangium sp. GDMCC 1.1324]
MPIEGNERDKNEYEALPLSDTAMAQLFRGELSRSDTWRSRLDNTTNWSLTTTAAVVSFGFSAAASPVVFLVGIWMVLSFLLIEARRYRYYDLWIRRVRLLENGYWVPMLRREPVDPDAMRELTSLIERPQIQLSLFSAISTRLNRAYGPILLVLTLTWFVKVYSHPAAPQSISEFMERAAVGPVPGEVVLAFLFVLDLVLAYLFAASYFTRAPMGELRSLPRGRRAALWESFYRPYATVTPRRRGRRKPSPKPPPPSSPPIQTPPMH